MSDIYTSPSFQFYPNDFLGDTQDLSATEIGAYIRLLCHAWKEGGIPSDLRAIARICRLSAPEMETAWQDALSRYWRCHPSDQSRLVNGRMEEVRAEALSKSQKAKQSASRRWEQDQEVQPEPLEAELDANAMRTQCKRNANAMRTHTERNANAMLVQQCDGNALLTPDSILHKDTTVSDAAKVVPMRNGGRPSLQDLAAYAILDAVAPLVRNRGKTMLKARQWRERNKTAALDLADNGKTPGMVVEMLEFAWDDREASRFYGDIGTLAKLVEHWPKLERIRTEPEDPEQLRRRVMNGDFLPSV